MQQLAVKCNVNKVIEHFKIKLDHKRQMVKIICWEIEILIIIIGK